MIVIQETKKEDSSNRILRSLSNKLDIWLYVPSIIYLIPKEPNASTMNKFRPINLVNCSFKLISKIITHILGLIMNIIIDDNQAVFLPNRYILYNVVISQ